MSRVPHFEIYASDPDAARNFYGSVFGWTFDRFGDWDYWEIRTGEGGINGGLNRREGSAPAADAPVCGATITVYVDDIDRASQRIVEAGGETAKPKMAVPGYGWAAYHKDPDGNVFGLFQEDQEAR